MGPVEKVDDDPFLLGDFDSGYEIAIPRDQRRVRDLVLAGEQREIKTQQQVDALLLIDGPALIVSSAKRQPSFSDLESAKTGQGLKEAA